MGEAVFSGDNAVLSPHIMLLCQRENILREPLVDDAEVVFIDFDADVMAVQFLRRFQRRRLSLLRCVVP